MKFVTEMETGKKFGFMTSDAKQALEKMAYTLGTEAVIKGTNSGKHLYFESNGKTYATANY